MNKGLSGVIHLKESDITDILRQHFARYGHGFKNITYVIDQSERDKPRHEIDILLLPLNRPKNDKLEKKYLELLSKCTENANIENVILKEVYRLVQSNEISSEEFIYLIEKIRGL